MIARVARQGSWSAWLVLALVAVLVRAVIPTGYMAAHSPTTGLNLVICSSQGTVTQAASNPDKQNAPQEHRTTEVCAFAGTHVAVTAPDAVRLPQPSLFAYAAAPLAGPEAVAPGRGLAAPPPPSTGPPLHA
jgi:hypothetical protein